MEIVRRGLRALSYAWRGARSAIVLSWYRTIYSGLKAGRGVKLGRGVYINVVKGGALILGDDVHLDSYAWISVEGTLVVGPRSYVGIGTTLVAKDHVAIGADALVAAYVTIRDQDHRFDDAKTPFNQQGLLSSPISIGNNVWIGTKASILRGVTIGNNAVLGAHAVLTNDLESGCVAVGIPARVVRKLRSPKSATVRVND